MVITKQRFIAINKYALIAAIILYLAGVFTPLKVLQPGIIFVFAAGFFLLLHQPYFLSRVKLAAHLWLLPAVVGALTYPILIERAPSGQNTVHLVLVLLISLLPFLLLITGTTEAAHSKKSRLKIVSARTVVQTFIFMLWATLTAFAFIKGSRVDLLFWGMFHVFTVAIFPFIIGRVLCGWLCPNATMQDALYKNMTFKRPIGKISRAIEEQSHSSAMYVSGQVDKHAPYLPFTLLLCWFPMFFTETVFDLTGVMWYPVAFMYGLIGLSLFMPWRKSAPTSAGSHRTGPCAGTAASGACASTDPGASSAKSVRPRSPAPFSSTSENRTMRCPQAAASASAAWRHALSMV